MNQYIDRGRSDVDKKEKVTADVMVAEKIKQYIVDQRLEAGDKLPTETELCDTMGVARHTLREGIKRLSQLGIVESKTGSGTYVSELSYEKMEEYLVFLTDRKEISKQEIYDVRIALESTAAAAAARNATDAELHQMEVILNRMRRAVDASDYTRFVEHNVEFHNAVVDISQNRLLIGITQIIQNLIRYSMYGTESDFKRNIQSSYEGHVEIYESIRNHDEEAASRCMTKHLRESSRNKV